MFMYLYLKYNPANNITTIICQFNIERLVTSIKPISSALHLLEKTYVVQFHTHTHAVLSSSFVITIYTDIYEYHTIYSWTMSCFVNF